MTLTIETGAGVAGADSYITVDECSAYAVAMYGAAINGNTADKEAALRRAFRFMDSLRWVGEAVYPYAQAWPRHDVCQILPTQIPQAVKDAQALFARAEFQDQGCLQPKVTLANQKVLTQADSLQWQVVGGVGVEASRAVVTAALDRLKPFLAGSQGQIMRG